MAKIERDKFQKKIQNLSQNINQKLENEKELLIVIKLQF